MRKLENRIHGERRRGKKTNPQTVLLREYSVGTERKTQYIATKHTTFITHKDSTGNREGGLQSGYVCVHQSAERHRDSTANRHGDNLNPLPIRVNILPCLKEQRKSFS